MADIIKQLEEFRAACIARCPGEPALMIAGSDIPTVTPPGMGVQCFIPLGKLIEAMKQQLLPA